MKNPAFMCPVIGLFSLDNKLPPFDRHPFFKDNFVSGHLVRTDRHVLNFPQENSSEPPYRYLAEIFFIQRLGQSKMINNKDTFIGIEHRWNLRDRKLVLDLVDLFCAGGVRLFCKFIVWGKTHILITVEVDAG